MWKAFERLVGWSIGNIYEVSAMNTRRNYNFDMAMEQWKGSINVLQCSGIFFVEPNLRQCLYADLIVKKLAAFNSAILAFWGFIGTQNK